MQCKAPSQSLRQAVRRHRRFTGACACSNRQANVVQLKQLAACKLLLQNSTRHWRQWTPAGRQLHSCHAIPADQLPPAQEQGTHEAQPDFVLEADGLKHKVHVFGIVHTSPQPSVATYILRNRPAAVVVETAVTPEHGARPGNAITCKDRVIEGSAAFYMRMFCQVAAALNEEAEQHGGDITATQLWQQVSSGPYRGEQLVYIAALACGIPLVFGDRPKDITYRRLYTMTTCAQLDEGYGQQAARNYQAMLKLPVSSSTLDTATKVERIAMQEREAIMCSVAHDAAAGCLPGITLDTPAPDAEAQAGSQANIPAGDVVMVIGAAHLPGIEQLWTGAQWRQLLGSSHTLDSDLLSAPPLTVVPEKEVGLRRGLLHALLRMSASAEVLADVQQTLGDVPPFQQQAFQGVTEVYGCTRMMLSCLDKQLLNQVCQSVRQEDGSQVDMWDVLTPVRAVRPSMGGPAYTEEIITFLRSLNFDLD